MKTRRNRTALLPIIMVRETTKKEKNIRPQHTSIQGRPKRLRRPLIKSHNNRSNLIHGSRLSDSSRVAEETAATRGT
jgi:hypothetical protein